MERDDDVVEPPLKQGLWAVEAGAGQGSRPACTCT